MPQISKGLRQAYQLQDLTFDAATALWSTLPRKDGKPTITREDAQSIGMLVRAWESCQQRIQVHRRVPNPGSLRPESPQAKRVRRSLSPMTQMIDGPPEAEKSGVWMVEGPSDTAPCQESPSAGEAANLPFAKLDHGPVGASERPKVVLDVGRVMKAPAAVAG